LAQRKTTKKKNRAGARKSASPGSSFAKRARQRVSEGTRKAASASLARARNLGDEARRVIHPVDQGPPHISLLKSPAGALPVVKMGTLFRVASYNVHRWAGLNGRGKPDLTRAGSVIEALDADIIALQEVLRPMRRIESINGENWATRFFRAFPSRRFPFSTSSRRVLSEDVLWRRDLIQAQGSLAWSRPTSPW